MPEFRSAEAIYPRAFMGSVFSVMLLIIYGLKIDLSVKIYLNLIGSERSLAVIFDRTW
jgi:hypothetical protein